MTEPRHVTWSSLIGHERIRDGIAAAIAQNRLGGSFLLVGPNGTGKHTIAMLLAQTLLCQIVAPVRKWLPVATVRPVSRYAPGRIRTWFVSRNPPIEPSFPSRC